MQLSTHANMRSDDFRPSRDQQVAAIARLWPRHLGTDPLAGVELPRRPDLRPQALTEASDWIDGQRERWEDLFDVVAEYLEADKEGR